MTTPSSTRSHMTSSATRTRTRTRALAVAGAALAALVVWTVAVPILDVDLTVSPGGGSPMSVGAGTVVVAALVGALLGWALLALLEARTARARTLWTGAAVVALLVSLGGPLNAATATSIQVTLMLMHLAVAAVLIPALRRTSPTT